MRVLSNFAYGLSQSTSGENKVGFWYSSARDYWIGAEEISIISFIS